MRNTSNDGVQTALWVIESVISETEPETGWKSSVLGDQGWLRRVLGDHDDPTFEKTKELCTCILTDIQREYENRKGKVDSRQPLQSDVDMHLVEMNTWREGHNTTNKPTEGFWRESL